MKPNYRIYFSLLVVSIGIIAASYCLSCDERLFAILSGVGCGVLTSTLVALLIDISNCAIERKRTLQIQKVSFYDLLNSYSFLLQTFMLMGKSRETEKKTWDEWLRLFISQKTEAETKFVIRQLEIVIEELRKIREQRVVLISEHIISNKEALALGNVESELITLKQELNFSLALQDTYLLNNNCDRIISAWIFHSSGSNILRQFNQIEFASPFEFSLIISDFINK